LYWGEALIGVVPPSKAKRCTLGFKIIIGMYAGGEKEVSERWDRHSHNKELR
jgi:hypothetical protein